MTDILLRRTGARPLRFVGETLARTVFPLTDKGVIALGLHTCAQDILICECVCCPPASYTDAAGLWPSYAAAPAATPDAAASIFEGFCPSATTSTLNVVCLAMEACMRAALREAIGEFLYTLAMR